MFETTFFRKISEQDHLLVGPLSIMVSIRKPIIVNISMYVLQGIICSL